MSQQSFLNKLLVIVLLVGAIVAAGYAMRHTLSVMLLSFIVAYLLDPIVVFLEQKRIKRTYGIAALYAILGLFTLFAITYLVPLLTIKWQELLHDLPMYIQKLNNLLEGWKSQIEVPYAAAEWKWLVDTVQNNVDAILANLGAGVYTIAGKVALNLVNLFLSPIFVFFMLFYKQDIIRTTIQWLPSARRDFLLAVGHDINLSLGGFIRGQVLVSLVVAVLSIVPLMLLDISHPLFCAIFAGLASVVPFVGVILATIPPLFFAYAQYQSLSIIIQVVVAFAVIYFLEGYLVKPLVFKSSLDLNPLATIFMVMAFGELMGFWGVILAIPITAALKIISNHLRAEQHLQEV